MFLGSRFYKSMDNGVTVEFRERLSTLFLIFLFDIAVFATAFVLIDHFLGFDPPTIALLGVIGVWAVWDGLFPFLIQRRIVIDRKNKVLNWTGGAARFIFKTRKIPLSDISGILIHETAESAFSEEEGPEGKDIIYLCVRGRSEIRIDAAIDEFYLNSLTHTLAEKIGCNVVTRRF